jgi:hypothetical protein
VQLVSLHFSTSYTQGQVVVNAPVILLWILLISFLPGQGYGHRVPSLDYAIGAVDSVFHVRFTGDGSQPAEVTVLEYQPPSGDDDVISTIALPGKVPGIPCSLGNNHWLVGSVACGATPAARQGWITRIQLLTSGTQCTGVQVVASTQCGSMDPHRLLFDSANQQLWMIDSANAKMRVAPYGPGGSLPSSSAWTDVGSSSEWTSARSLIMAMPQDQEADSINWWSPWEPQTLHRYAKQVNGAWAHSTLSAPAKLVQFAGFPAINSMASWSTTTIPSAAWRVAHSSAGQLCAGTVATDGVLSQAATGSARGLEGQTATLTVGSRKVSLPIIGLAGRPVGMTGVEIGALLVGRAPIGTRVLPTVPLSLSGVSCSGWLFVGWRDPSSNQDPIVWQNGVAVIDLSSAATAVLPISVSESELLGEFCSRALVVPDDQNLNGSCVVVQYVLESSGSYCVSEVAAAPVFGSGAVATASQINAANASWRSGLSQAPSPPTMNAILQSLQGR